MADNIGPSDDLEKHPAKEVERARGALFDFFSHVSVSEYGDLPESAHIDRWKEIFRWLPDGSIVEFADRLETSDRAIRSNAHRFVDRFKISQAESRLLHSLLQGLTVVDHAREFKISINTARSQMRKLLEKTHSANQLDLVRLYHKHTSS